jgi:sphingolipid delta-4 desaturase
VGYVPLVLQGRSQYFIAPDYSLYGGAESLSEGRPPRRVRVEPADKHVHPPQDPADFLWLHTEEPHRSRRRAILAAHPEVTRLMGHEPRTKFVVAGVVALQLGLAYAVRGWGWWPLVALAYAVGGTANHNLFLAIHEITHNLAFKGIRANKTLALFANLPIGVPYCAAFKVHLPSICIPRAVLTSTAEVPHRAPQAPW